MSAQITAAAQPRIAIIGLGYVGLPLAVEFGKTLDVLGYDIDAARVAELQAGHDHTLELDDAELAAGVHARYSARGGRSGSMQYLHRHRSNADRCL